jgi:hypothetical protein
MKHLFFVHSPLTFLLACSVIEHLKLKKEDVIILTIAYKVPIDEFKVYPIFYTESAWYKKIFSPNYPKKYDSYIEKITQNSLFTAYIAWMSYYNKVLITHPNCKEFHFIEEGVSTYQTHHELSDISWSIGNKAFRVSSFFDKFFIRSLITVLRGFN